MEECHAGQVKALAGETEEQRSRIAQMEKDINCLQTELAAQKEANSRSPSNTMKNLVERLKAQLTQKEKQLKVVLSHVLLFLGLLTRLMFWERDRESVLAMFPWVGLFLSSIKTGLNC